MAQKRYPQTSPEYADALKRAEDLVVESEGLIKNKVRFPSLFPSPPTLERLLTSLYIGRLPNGASSSTA